MKLKSDDGKRFFIRGRDRIAGLDNVVFISQLVMSYKSFVFNCAFKGRMKTDKIKGEIGANPYSYGVRSGFGVLEGEPDYIYGVADSRKRKFRRRMFFDILYAMYEISRNWDKSVWLYD